MPNAAERLSHAYIVAGPRGEQRKEKVLELVQKYVCTGSSAPCLQCQECRRVIEGIHPDVSFFGEEKAINVATVREIHSDAYIRPNQGKRKVYILDRADEMNSSAQNAMLKLLEEGPAYVAFLLLAEQDGSLLVTVRSRCETMRMEQLMGELPDPEILEQAEKFAGLMMGGDELAMMEHCVSLEKWDRNKLTSLFNHTAESLHRSRNQGEMKHRLRCISLLKEMKEALFFNTGAGHVLGRLASQIYMK